MLKTVTFILRVDFIYNYFRFYNNFEFIESTVYQ